MKRMIALLLFAAMMWTALPAVAEGPVTAARLLEMARTMDKLTNSDYLTLKNVPEEMQAIARSWSRAAAGMPRLIVRANVQDSAVMNAVRTEAILEPPIVQMEMESTVLSEIIYYLAWGAAAESGVTGADYETIAEVNGFINGSMMYADPDAEDGYGLYFLLYEDGTPLVVTANQENGTVSLAGFFLPSLRLAKCANSGQVAMWLLLNGYTMTCEEMPLP